MRRHLAVRSEQEIALSCSAAEYDKIVRVIPKMLSQYFSALGRKSVKARMRKLSPEKRQEIARNAARARWAKARNSKEAKRRARRKS